MQLPKLGTIIECVERPTVDTDDPPADNFAVFLAPEKAVSTTSRTGLNFGSGQDRYDDSDGVTGDDLPSGFRVSARL